MRSPRLDQLSQQIPRRNHHAPKEIEQRTAPKNEALNSTRHVPTGRSTNSRMTEKAGIMSIVIPQKVQQH